MLFAVDCSYPQSKKFGMNQVANHFVKVMIKTIQNHNMHNQIDLKRYNISIIIGTALFHA